MDEPGPAALWMMALQRTAANDGGVLKNLIVRRGIVMLLSATLAAMVFCVAAAVAPIFQLPLDVKVSWLIGLVAGVTVGDNIAAAPKIAIEAPITPQYLPPP